MKNQLISVVVGVGVLALGGAAWYFAPRLQEPTRVINVRAETGTERARRILAQYNAEMDTVASIVDQSGFPAVVDRERVSEVVEYNSHTAKEALEAQAELLNELRKQSIPQMQQLNNRLSELDPQAEVSPSSRTTFSANTPSMISDMKEGLQGREKVLERNSRQLAEAAKAVTQSLSDAEGEVTGRDNLHINRINGIVLHQQGLDQQRRLDLLRQEATATLRRLQQASRAADALRNQTKLGEVSGVDAKISDARSTLSEAEQARDELQQQVSKLEGEIESLRGRIDEQLAIAEEARTTMETLERRGLQFEQTNPVEQFRREFEPAAARYREAVRQAQSLQHGTLGNARIDETGDYVHGKFVSEPPSAEIEYQPGLDEYERQLASLKTELQGQEAIVANARSTLDRLEQLRDRYQSRKTDAGDRIAELEGRAAELYAQYVSLRERIRAGEDVAVKKFLDAAKAFDAARRLAESRVQSAPEMSPQALERSPYSLIQQDNWLPAQLQAQAADSQVWAALVLHDRYAELKRDLRILERVRERTDLSGFDGAALEGGIAETKQQAEEILDKAITALERAGRGLREHWTVAASLAAADYVLALFDNPALVDVALANYKNVIEDRRDNPLVKPFLDRYEQLRVRQPPM